MLSELKITLVEYDIAWENTEKNFHLINEIIGNIKSGIFILPEMFSYGFSMNVESIAEEPYGKSFKFLQQLAIKKNAVFCASIPIKSRGGYYNRFYWIEPNETFITYDKRHLFSYGEEDKFYTQGNKKTIIDYKGWRILPQICYDLRFPVFSRNNSEDMYDLAIYVANWPKKRNYAWNTLLKARAIENMAYVAGVNRVGEDGNQLEYSGESIIIDSLGEPLIPIEKKENLLTYNLSRLSLDENRNHFKFLNDADDFKII